MTELLFYTDAYLRSCEAQVLSANESGIVLTAPCFIRLVADSPAMSVR